MRDQGQDADLAYSIETKAFPSGRTLYNWCVTHSGFPVAAGACLPTREDAVGAALKAIAARRSDLEQPTFFRTRMGTRRSRGNFGRGF